MSKEEIVLLNNNPLSSGVGRYAYELYRHLAKLNLKVDFVSWDKVLFNSLYNSLRPLKLNWLYYMVRLRTLAKKVENHALLTHVANAGYLATVIDEIKGHRVITVHDLVPFVAPRSIEDYVVRKAIGKVVYADFIICPSQNTKRDLTRLIDVDPKKVRVINYGVDHELFRPREKLEARRELGLPLDRPIILNVGSEEPRKNILTLLKSFKRLLTTVPNALLLRVGERTTRVGKLIRTLGLSGKVLYRRASESEIAYYYNAADLLVHPAYYEGFGNPPLEAMASGLPVIAGNKSSIPEIVGDAGVLLDPFDVDGFAYWMREALINEDLKARLSEKGYERSLNFSWEKCAKETLEVYREVVDEA